MKLMNKGSNGGCDPHLTNALAQRPQLILIEVGIPLNAIAWGESVCQEPVLPVERIPISVLWRGRERRQLAG